MPDGSGHHAAAPTPELLDTLCCDWQARPRNAPSFFDLKDHLLGLHREDGALILEYYPAAALDVAALVDAERACCASLTWNLEGSPASRVRIAATPAQLEILEAAARGEGG